MKRNRITKETIPEGFSVRMALVDSLPVLFFGIACALIGFMIRSPLFILGSLLAAVSGAVKVLWKIIVAAKKRNIWILFIQMRIVMPIGLVLAIVGFILFAVMGDFSGLQGFTHWLSIVFLSLAGLGILLMVLFSVILDSSDAKSNWIEQITNSIAQGCLLIACLIAFCFR